jgi:hypothetical protein
MPIDLALPPGLANADPYDGIQLEQAYCGRRIVEVNFASPDLLLWGVRQRVRIDLEADGARGLRHAGAHTAVPLAGDGAVQLFPLPGNTYMFRISFIRALLKAVFYMLSRFCFTGEVVCV